MIQVNSRNIEKLRELIGKSISITGVSGSYGIKGNYNITLRQIIITASEIGLIGYGPEGGAECYSIEAIKDNENVKFLYNSGFWV